MAAAAAVLEVALEVPDNCKLNKFQQDTAELFQGLEREQLLKWMQSQKNSTTGADASGKY